MVFQLVAAAAGFAWSAGIAGVFTAPVTMGGTDIASVCYYRYPARAALLALSTPLLLLHSAFEKVKAVIKSLRQAEFGHNDHCNQS